MKPLNSHRRIAPRIPFLFALGVILLFGLFSLHNQSGVAQQTQSDDVVRVNTNLVLVNATVTDKQGHPVTGLRQSDFKLTEDSQPQTVSFFGAQSTPFAAIILLDTSGSMEQRMALARSAAARFVEELRPDDQVAVYRFDSKVVKIQDFSSSSDLSSRIYDTRADGMTVLYDAIVQAARDLSVRTEARKAIVVLSDGEDTQSKATMDRALNSALAVDAAIYSIDMTQDGTGDVHYSRVGRILKELSEKSGGIYVASAGGPALRDACKNIVQELGEQYTLGYTPANQNYDGRWRSIEVQSSRPGLSVRARKGYRAARVK